MSHLTVRIAGKSVTRESVLAWEDKRIDAAARKAGIVPPTCATVAQRRDAFLTQKLDLGADELARRLQRDTNAADFIARTQARVSPRRRVSRTDMSVNGGTAAEFVTYFERASANSDEQAMLRACPDHFVIRMGPRGQEVLETNGGSPLAALFVIDYDDVSSLRTRPDPAFPHQVAGVARASDGRAIGGVRHQFRDTAGGFDARLIVEFPLPTLPTMVSRHRWHLACEFSNWVEAAFAL